MTETGGTEVDPDIFDMLVENTDEGPEQGQPDVDQDQADRERTP